MWCMQSNTAQGDAATWLREQANMQGVSHDGVNTVYTHTPPKDLIPEGSITIPVGSLMDVVMVCGGFLLNSSDNLLLGTKEQFCYLYTTPFWKVWCGNYEDTTELLMDAVQVFGGGFVFTSDDLSEQVQEAKTALKTMLVQGVQ